AQQLSELTAPEIDRDSFSNISTESWIPSFVLSSIFVRTFNERRLRLAYVWIRRTVAAVESYKEACQNLFLVSRSAEKIGLYFKALDQIERTISLCYQANDYGRKVLDHPLFTKNDGSIFQRLNAVYNAARHSNLSALPDGQIHPVWLVNKGVCCREAQLEYRELERILIGLVNVAVEICNISPNPLEPKTMA
ncbi:MAG TPA: hypothetical protein VH000_09920, partial [Rhizomicrobium sp.]|nr:hypothetical protein [Rhizomicrobium sp.]